MTMTRRGEQMQANVLAVLRHSGGAMSAYGILENLRASNPKLAPPTIYRALAALSERGVVHRLESQNAFIACQSDHGSDATVLSICNDCGSVEESAAPDVLKDLSSLAEKTGFVPKRHVVEIIGRCGDCASPENKE